MYENNSLLDENKLQVNSLMATSTKVVFISTEQQYTKQYWMSMQIRYRSCDVLVPYSGNWYQWYQMLVSIMKMVPFLYCHVYWDVLLNACLKYVKMKTTIGFKVSSIF